MKEKTPRKDIQNSSGKKPYNKPAIVKYNKLKRAYLAVSVTVQV